MKIIIISLITLVSAPCYGVKHNAMRSNIANILISASKAGHYNRIGEIAKLAAQYDVEIDAITFGEALQDASKNGHPDIIEKLLELAYIQGVTIIHGGTIVPKYFGQALQDAVVLSNAANSVVRIVQIAKEQDVAIPAEYFRYAYKRSLKNQRYHLANSIVSIAKEHGVEVR